VVVPFFGGMPMCHGAGGLAGQYYFGARTGGANIIEGLIEIFLGLFLAASIAQLLAAFPEAIIGAMLLLVGIELARFAAHVRLKGDLAVLAVTVVISVIANMALGFVAGLAMHYLLEWVSKKERPGGRAGPPSKGQGA
jgi:MFS superfamily sulfate permease-like transporter